MLWCWLDWSCLKGTVPGFTRAKQIHLPLRFTSRTEIYTSWTDILEPLGSEQSNQYQQDIYNSGMMLHLPCLAPCFQSWGKITFLRLQFFQQKENPQIQSWAINSVFWVRRILIKGVFFKAFKSESSVKQLQQITKHLLSFGQDSATVFGLCYM